MPNLSLNAITKALAALGSAAFLTSCTKQEIAPDQAKAREVPSATVAGSVAPAPPPVATATAASADNNQKEEGAVDAGAARKKMGGPAGATSGQMSCGAGKCSGEVSGKKK